MQTSPKVEKSAFSNLYILCVSDCQMFHYVDRLVVIKMVGKMFITPQVRKLRGNVFCRQKMEK